MRFAKEWSEDNQILQRDDPPASGAFGNWLWRRSWRSKRKLGQLQNSQRGFSYRGAVIVKLLEQQGNIFSRRITGESRSGENHKLPFGLREMFAPLWLRLPGWLSWCDAPG